MKFIIHFENTTKTMRICKPTLSDVEMHLKKEGKIPKVKLIESSDKTIRKDYAGIRQKRREPKISQSDIEILRYLHVID